jgi:hypothetical protein
MAAASLLAMNGKKQNPLTSGKLKDVLATFSANLSVAMPKLDPAPKVTSNPLLPAELDQDAGGRYNTNGSFPQR